MNRVKIKKRIKATSIFLLLLGTIILNVNLIYWNFTENRSLIEEEDYSDFESFDFQLENLKTSDYQISFNGSGGNLDIKLHQSYLNTSFNTSLNPSDSNNNSFYIPCPTDTTFNSSYTRFDIDEIYAPNKSLSIEEDYQSDVYMNSDIVTSFTTISDNCYLINASFNIFVEAGNPGITAYLYNSSSGAPVTASVQVIGTFQTGTGSGWKNFKLTKTLLDSTTTENNKWFIGIRKTDGLPATACKWRWDPDPPGGTDGTDDTDAYSKPGVTWNLEARDYTLKLYLAPLSNIPKPSGIGLEINNTDVSDVTNGTGYWTTINQEYTDSDGDIEFEVTADWWNASCRIAQAQINYTKTDLKASSNFEVPGSGQSINWNSTLGAINNFDATFNDYRINFTVPSTWENFTATDGSINKTSDISLGPISNKYRDLQIRDAGNGINWYITAQSYNLLQTIRTYVNAVEWEVVNFTDTVTFQASFSETIGDGSINLSVYSPAPGYYENHTYFNNSLVASKEIPLDSWKISDTAENVYGPYKVQLFWNNDTAAGFLEKDLTISAVTELVLDSPPIGQDRFTNELFNISVFYNDTGYNKGDMGITGANIVKNSTLLTWVEEGSGFYSLEVNTSKFSFGWNYIEIEASKTYYNAANTTFSFHLRQNTTISPSDTKDFGDVLRGYNVSYTFYYSDVGTNPVIGATIEEVSLPPGFIYSANPVGGTPGNYTIELDTSGVIASDTPYTCIFNITAVGAQTQNITLTLRVIYTQTDIQLILYDDYLIRKNK
ncbi:MAG: hypothetical protein KAT66_04450, partial [Candidatus Lokiarchaeota archaeon]|nr:hypothetical protein [Candidatus Lokiarchaeota archaeon]